MSVKRIIHHLERHFGRPKKILHGDDPLEVLIETILSQNTSDKNSDRAYRSLRISYPRWSDLASASPEEIEGAIKIGGLQRIKSRRILSVLHTLKASYGSFDLTRLKRIQTEKGMHMLASMDGIGVKTAACVFLFSFGRDVFPVDTHIHRILNRLGVVNTTTPGKTFFEMRQKVPKGNAYSLHINLIRLGRTICRHRNPRCDECPIEQYCLYGMKA